MTQSRKPVSKRLRFEIFRRDGFRCRYCGLTADETGDGLTVDHVVPVALGGDNEPGNLVTACKDCNAGKTSASPDEHHVAQVADDAVRWASAMKAASELRRDHWREQDAEIDELLAYWATWSSDAGPVPMDHDHRDSLSRFMDAGLSLDDMMRLARVAMTSRAAPERTWRFFCGCCWNEIKDRQADARALLETVPRTDPPVSDVQPTQWWSTGSILGDFRTPMIVVAAISDCLQPADRESFTDGYVFTAALDGDDDVLEAFFASTAGGHSAEHIRVP